MSVRMGWGRALALLGALTLAIYLYLALFVPGTLTYAPFTIQDDAREFGAWWPQTVDPTLLSGDLLASYWRAVSPWGYRLPFSLAGDLGMDPVLFSRLLPVPLTVLSLWAAWRLALKLTADRRVAFFAAAFCFAYFIHDDSLFGSTPRSFSHPLLFLALNAIVARRNWLGVAWLAILASFYPTTAIAGFGILGVAQLRRGERWPLVLPWRSLLPLGIGAALIVLAALPLQERAKPWGPVITVEQALSMPNMNRHDGRSSIVDEHGRIAWVCSARIGYLPEALPCDWDIPGALPINALVLVPLIVLGVRATRGRPDPEQAERNLIYLHAWVACTICFVVAALVAFDLHFPGRYTQRILGPLEWLAIGQVLGEWLTGKSWRWYAAPVAVLLAFAVTPLPGFIRPPDPGLLRFIRRLPPTVRIGGVSDELDPIPALTGRAITAAVEEAIPWHMGYYRPFERNMVLSLQAVSTSDPAALAAAIAGSRADYLLVDRRLLEHAVLPERYAPTVPDAAAEAARELARRPSLVQRDAARCVVYRGTGSWLLDAACLTHAASGRV